MMKYFKLNDDIYAFELDGSQDEFIAKSMVPMTEDEIDRHLNPQNYLTDEEKQQLARQNMPTLSPIEFDIKLNRNGLYDAVQDLIKDNFELRIAYTRAIFFSRTDPFINQARLALNLTDEQVDEMWLYAMTL